MKTTLMAACLLFAAPAFADEAIDVWKAKCKSCHAENGNGDTKVGKKEKVEDLTSGAWQAKATDADIKKVIREGSPDNNKMKPFKDKLSDAEIDSLVRLIRGFKS
jgi:mono/diheme cytochrome c family protein